MGNVFEVLLYVGYQNFRIRKVTLTVINDPLVSGFDCVMGQWIYAKTTYLVACIMMLSYTGVICLERCPEECHCLDTHIDCSRRGLTGVPLSLPSWATTLYSFFVTFLGF